MKGFFEKEKAQLPYKSEKGVHSCASCGLYKFTLSPRMKPYGNFKKGIMVIGEAPGEDEDKKGKPWQGRMGRALQRQYKQLGVDIFEDCVSVNAISCRPVDKKGANRAPSEFEISCCRQKVLSAIKRYEPHVIIIHGNAAISSVIGYRWKKELGGIVKWRGWTIPDRDFNAWICPTFHPSFVERQEEVNEIHVIWREDLEKAFAKASERLPEETSENQIIIADAGEVLERIEDEARPLLAFDIETTGLKPYNTQIHELACVSFCNSDDVAYASPAPSKRKHWRHLKRVLENPKIGKIAANMKFEDHWKTIMYGINTHPWAFDTMLAAHVLDNRPGITGLKFQAYVRFGVLGYGDEIAPYLKSPDTYSVNKIKDVMRNEKSFERLLTYCGMDSLLTYKLAHAQMRELNYKW